MDTTTAEYARLRRAITDRLNAHDLLGVMGHGAPATEYRPEPPTSGMTALAADRQDIQRGFVQY